MANPFYASDRLSIQRRTLREIPVQRTYSVIEKYALLRSHPRAMLTRSVGTIWAFYFMWENLWPLALASAFISAVVGYFVAGSVNYEKVGATTLGKIALLHLHPVNLTVQALGLVVLLSGLWYHNTVQLLSGFSLILLGHLFGWEK
jgi:hypothetical protein